MKRTLMTLMATGAIALGGDYRFPVGGSVEEMMAWQARQGRELDRRYEAMEYEAQQHRIEQRQQRILEELEQLRNQDR